MQGWLIQKYALKFQTYVKLHTYYVLMCSCVSVFCSVIVVHAKGCVTDCSWPDCIALTLLPYMAYTADIPNNLLIL